MKEKFYKGINGVIANNNYTVIASAIRKNEYIMRFGKLSDDVYEISLSFIVERVVYYLNELNIVGKELEIIIERRGTREDKKLEEHFHPIARHVIEPERANPAFDLLSSKVHLLKIYP